MCSSPLSTIASGHGSPYFSSRSFSRLPAFTPIRIEQLLSFAALITSRTRQARHLLNATEQDLDQALKAAVRQTNNAYRAVIAGIEQVGAFNQAMVSAESALEATQAGFEVGTRTIVDVLIAEQRNYQAQRDNSVARHAYILNHLRLKAVAGLLTAEDLSVVNQLLQ